jgi:hypothetical protein
MKKFVWFLGGIAAATTGFLVWHSARSKAAHTPGYYLDDDPSDEPNFV